MRWRFSFSVADEEHKKLIPGHKKMPLGLKTVTPGHKKVTPGSQKGAPGWHLQFSYLTKTKSSNLTPHFLIIVRIIKKNPLLSLTFFCNLNLISHRFYLVWILFLLTFEEILVRIYIPLSTVHNNVLIPQCILYCVAYTWKWAQII